MQKLYEITIPGLSMQTDFPAVRHRLLADFPDVLEVLVTTTPATVLVVYRGDEEIDGWLDALSDSIATRRISLGRTPPGAPQTPPAPHDRCGDGVTPAATRSLLHLSGAVAHHQDKEFA
jgi:hypothetical protein